MANATLNWQLRKHLKTLHKEGRWIVLTCYILHANQRSRAWPSLVTLKAETGLSHTTIIAAKSWLESKGALKPVTLEQRVDEETKLHHRADLMEVTGVLTIDGEVIPYLYSNDNLDDGATPFDDGQDSDAKDFYGKESLAKNSETEVVPESLEVIPEFEEDIAIPEEQQLPPVVDGDVSSPEDSPPPPAGGDDGTILIQGIELPLHIARMEPGELMAQEGYTLTRTLADTLDDWLHDYPLEEVNAAIWNASMQGVRKPSYINSTLQRWHSARSPAEARDAPRSQRRGRGVDPAYLREMDRRFSTWDEVEH